NFFYTVIVILTILVSCSKKVNSRTGEEDTQSTTTTTSGNGGTSTTGNLTGSTATSISGSASCTLTPKQVLASNIFPANSTLAYGSNFQSSPTKYQMYNYQGNFESYIFFGTVGPPAAGGYTIVPQYMSSDVPGQWEASVKLMQYYGSANAVGVGQSGVVYVTHTGTLVTATYCNIPVSVNLNFNNYTVTASARVEN
ncbi:MAG: hypothetical protein V4677_07345, partial [Bacteroidota bacterium]